jgi:hypothetical protein
MTPATAAPVKQEHKAEAVVVKAEPQVEAPTAAVVPAPAPVVKAKPARVASPPNKEPAPSRRSSRAGKKAKVSLSTAFPLRAVIGWLSMLAVVCSRLTKASPTPAPG